MKMSKIKLLIFDLDGTLVDSKLDLANAVNYALKSLDLPPVRNKIIYDFIGDGVWQLVERSFGPKNSDKVEEGFKLFRDYYKEHLLDTTVLYPGVEDTLKCFKKLRKCVVTNKSEAFSKTIINGLNIEHYFDLVYGGDTFDKRKPDPFALLKAIEELKVSPSETIMIGDSRNDILVAKAANTVSCAVGYGLEDRETLLSNKPDFFIESITELRNILKGNILKGY